MQALGGTQPDVLAAYVEAARPQVKNLALSLTRAKSRAGREVLARLAAPEMTAAELEAGAVGYLGGVSGDRAAFAASLQLPAALEYAYVAAAQDIVAADRQVARGLLTAVADVHGEEALGQRDVELLLQLALKARDFSTAERLLSAHEVRGTVRQFASIDALNPWIRPDVDESVWLARLNDELYGDWLHPVTLVPHGATPFDRLTAGTTRPVRHERKITVIMSSYNPDPTLLTAVRSVVEQTWQNFELLVVDDASPAPTPGVLEAAERMDPRVRVIRKAVNGGTYRARNTALTQATGDFFTCVDSDDWAHPQRLERSVQPLLSDPSLLATRGFGLRATSDLELSRVGRRGRIVVSSSLMVRTYPVLNRLGFFDPVRKGADNEYALRLEAAFGGYVLDLPEDILTVLLADEDSLSASDFSTDWRHPARAEYSASQRHFHRDIASGRSTAFLDPEAPRRFPAPRLWERYPQDGEPGGVLDLCVVADWRAACVDDSTVGLVVDAVEQGSAIGVVHLESVHAMRRRSEPVAPALRELIATCRVERVYLDEGREVDTVVVADPRPFQYPGETTVRLRAHRVYARRLTEPESRGQYDRVTVGRHLADVFGVAPEWGVSLPHRAVARAADEGAADG